MLKIKDNVDLKELERYGFKLNDKEWYVAELTGGILCQFCVKPISREIVCDCNGFFYVTELDVMYDLIKDGLVEKIEDGDNNE